MVGGFGSQMLLNGEREGSIDLRCVLLHARDFRFKPGVSHMVGAGNNLEPFQFPGMHLTINHGKPQAVSQEALHRIQAVK